MTNGFVNVSDHQALEITTKEAKPSMEAILAVIATNIDLFQEQIDQLKAAKFMQPDPMALNLAEDLHLVADRIRQLLQD